MKKAIIGYTGFVGSNICKSKSFDDYFNSKNIDQIKGQEYEELVITGVPAVKWLANKEPLNDWSNIEGLINNLKQVKAKRVFLISTVDVYPSPVDVNEDEVIDKEICQPYGKHRLMFEDFVNEQFEVVHTMRLPGLFGEGLKKNIIFDFLENNMIENIESRNVFQFYSLTTINHDMELAAKNNIKTLNVSVEPISVKEVAQVCGQEDFENHLENNLVKYDFKSKHCAIWGGNDGYLYSKEHCLQELKNFVREYK